MAPDIPTEHVMDIIPEASAETIEAFVASLQDDFEYPALTHLSSTSEDFEPEDEEIDDAEHDEEETPANDSPASGDDDEPSDPSALPDGFILIKGQPVAITDVERLYDFDQFLRSDPDASERVAQAVKPIVPTPTPAPASQELTPPEWMDLEDPQQKFMWDSHVANQNTLAAVAQQAQQREQELSNQRAVADMDVALTRFRSAHPNFNDDQITALRLHARDMNIIGAVMATAPNQVDGFVRTMDLAAMDSPDLRSIYLTPETPSTPTRQQKSATRKRQLNALGGSSGSAPRTSPAKRPMSDREAIEQMAAGLAESFQSN